MTILHAVHRAIALFSRGQATHVTVAPQLDKALVRVTAVRARVLCPHCIGQNDEGFRYCQFCGDPPEQEKTPAGPSPLQINEQALQSRAQEFQNAMAKLESIKRRGVTADLFSRFLISRVGGGAKYIENAQPQDVVDFLCWFDACGDGRTVVHAIECEAVGTDSLEDCSTVMGVCAKRYAHESLRTNYVSKLAVTFEREFGAEPAWNDTLRVGNPVKSELVTQYMAFTRAQQKTAGVLVKQAPVLLRSHLEAIVGPLSARLQWTSNPTERLRLARNIALFTVAFSTTKRGDELTRTLIQRILRLPNKCGFLFNFQWGKTMRDGSDHLLTIPYEERHYGTCPILAIEQYVAVGTFVGWDMTKGYLFPTILEDTTTGEPIRGTKSLSRAQMTSMLKASALEAKVPGDFSMHSFRSGGAVSRALAGDDLSTIMQRAFWKSPTTAWRYMQLAKVTSPGTAGFNSIPGVSETQYREINEFPLSEQSREWAAFGKVAMVADSEPNLEI